MKSVFGLDGGREKRANVLVVQSQSASPINCLRPSPITRSLIYAQRVAAHGSEVLPANSASDSNTTPTADLTSVWILVLLLLDGGKGERKQ